MRLLDISFKRPQENLAFDEVLLNGLDSKKSGETLRFWESDCPFVVLGVSDALREHVNEKLCREDRVPILRRISAGGCVLQGPGCLNFSLILRHDHRPEIRTIRESYCYILGRIIQSFEKRGLLVKHKGTSDLALRGKKVSGNAQRRRKKVLLHHGTLLYKPDAEAMERYLKEPRDRPQYRGRRTHRGFVEGIGLPVDELRAVVREAFDVEPSAAKAERWEVNEAHKLATEKYLALNWIRRK